ncbi:hypothetical protein KJZ61_02115 [Candidatus Dependentiae bacterium]|nr:hypothetical protein [Candidatus Dependentiae bacterium]
MKSKNIIFTLLAITVANSTLVADPGSSSWAWIHRLGTSVKPLLGTFFRKTAECGPEAYHYAQENPIKVAAITLLSATGLWGAYRCGHRVGFNQAYWKGVRASEQLNGKHWETDSAAKLRGQPIRDLQKINNHLDAYYDPGDDLALKYPYNVENTGHNTVQLGRMSGRMYNNLSEDIDNLNAKDDNLSLKEKTDALKERMRKNMKTLSNYHLSEGINLGFALAAYSGEYTEQNFLSIEKLENIVTPMDHDTAKQNRINNYIRNQLDNQRRVFRYTCKNPNATLQETIKHQRVHDTQFTEQLDERR